MPLLTVIIPVYNEARTIRQILEKVNSVNIEKEIIIVDDGSTDGTGKALRDVRYDNLKIIYHSTNRGKGAAFQTALANASGEFVIIQDADLEYEPQEYIKLMEVMKRENVNIVLGARFTKGYRGLLIPRLGNRFLTILLNLLFGTQLNDCLTCYKLFRKEIIRALDIKSQGFQMEIEIVVKALKRRLKIKEIPISYRPRDYREGKKIRWLDGLHAIVDIFKYRFFE